MMCLFAGIFRLGLLAIVSLSSIGNAVVRQVPQEYTTIQSAFDAVQDHDTVLVDSGVYAEALTAPLRIFMLKGNVDVDTGEVDRRPIIDPSTLSNPRTRGCLLIPAQSHPVIEDVVFRNGPQMFPHEEGLHGGIRSFSPDPVFRRCLWDSTFYGIAGFPSYPTLISCRFEHVQRYGLIHGGNLQAVDTYIQGKCAVLASVGPGSTLQRCELRAEDSVGTLLNARGPRTVIQDCIIGTFSFSSGFAIQLRDSGIVFENNTILDGHHTFTDPILDVDAYCGSSQPITIRHNRFFNITDNQLIRVYCEDASDGIAAIVENNIIDRCSERNPAFTKTLWLDAAAIVTGNHFTNLAPFDVPTVYVGTGGTSIHQNIFSATGFAMAADSNLDTPTDATQNWWGDSTGPYHLTLNPDGRGDVVGDNIVFSPWLTDTLLHHRERDIQLPTQRALAVAPNPFNGTTRVTIEVDHVGVYRLELFDLLGRKVRDLWGAPLIDRISFPLDLTEQTSGIYYIRLWRNSDRRPVAYSKIALVR